MRRKFYDLFAATQSPTASEAIRRIGELYAFEKKVRGSPPEIRLAARQARARPFPDELKHWLDQTLKTLSTKSDMAGAIRYALARWAALTRYLDDGTVEIDNNAAERALGRKNYLFAGSNRAENEPRLYALCSAPPGSTASTPNTTCATSSPTSPTIPSAASQSSCPGTCRPLSSK